MFCAVVQVVTAMLVLTLSTHYGPTLGFVSKELLILFHLHNTVKKQPVIY